MKTTVAEVKIALIDFYTELLINTTNLAFSEFQLG